MSSYYVPGAVLGTEVAAMNAVLASVVLILYKMFHQVPFHTPVADTTHQSQHLSQQDLSQHAILTRLLPVRGRTQDETCWPSDAKQTTLNHLWFPTKSYCLDSCHLVSLLPPSPSPL